MLLFAREPGKANVEGHLVGIAQAALAAQGFDPGGTDGVYGRGTARAVRRWQAATGREATGALLYAEWSLLTGLPAPTTRDLCIQATAAIEGHGFETVVGNFDGAGVTWGLMGFALTGGLPALLSAIDADAGAGPHARSIFADGKWDRLLDAARGDRDAKRAFGDAISLGASKVRVRDDWERAFERLGRLPAVQRLQLDATASYWERAVDAAERHGANETLCVGMMYDACIQHGSISGKRRDLMDGVGQTRAFVATRRAWAHAMADATSARWRDRVLARRMLFAEGEGRVHGADYDLMHWGFAAPLPEPDALRGQGVSLVPDEFRAPAPVAPAVHGPVDWLEEIPVPEGLNVGVRHASHSYLVSHLGMPRGDFSQRCRPPTDNVFRAQCDFGFELPQIGRVGWALRAAKDAIADLLAELARRNREVYDLSGHIGVGCCRYVRGSTTSISAHSMGTAIDWTLGGRVDPYDNDRVTRGMLEVIRTANDLGWYSGIYFRREDAMHLEASREMFERWLAAGLVVSRASPAGAQVGAMPQQGHRGDEVRALQRMLNAIGAGLRVDGDFGPATTSAVKSFQHRVGLRPDGIATPETVTALQVAASQHA